MACSTECIDGSSLPSELTLEPLEVEAVLRLPAFASLVAVDPADVKLRNPGDATTPAPETFRYDKR